MPFPGTRVVHPNFAAHHRPVTVGVMGAVGRLLRYPATPGDWDPATGEVDEPDAVLLYEGPARVQVRPATTRDADAAGQAVTSREYLLQLDDGGFLTPPEGQEQVVAGTSGDVWITDTCADDPLLVARRLRVTDVQVASTRWTRDLTAVDDLSNP